MNFPAPDSVALARSHTLTQLIQEKISGAGGNISFAEFMELALYTPELGYYTANSPKFGREGDFITAPEISPLFAEAIAEQWRELFPQFQYPSILEIGAGSGIFSADLLLRLESLGCLPEQYYIFDISPALKKRQHETILTQCSHLLSRVTWLDSLDHLTMTGLIIANEVVDALPVDCFKVEKQKILERCVTWQNNHFSWELSEPHSHQLAVELIRLQDTYSFTEGYASEVNLAVTSWIKSLANVLQKGLILVFDYGYGEREYYHPDRSEGTLCCYYQHHKNADPFAHVGLQDITSHVNFTQLVNAAMDAGLALRGYTTQGAFLLSCDILGLSAAKPLSEVKNFQQNQSLKTLLLPSQMGEAVKVMALGKNLSTALKGFSFYDNRRNL